jgi:daunorubicin resistance ABC transporter ATP-binding subunit
MSTSPVIQASGLGKRFDDLVAVRDLSFSVEAGQVLGLLGPNGAGKTTTINMMTTLSPIDTGTASVDGYDVASRPAIVRQLIGLAGQAAAVDEKLTARENLELFARLYKIPKERRTKRIDELIERFDLGRFADRVAGTYSGGERRRLDVVAALVADPPALFLDEPTTGLDPRSRVELWDAIRSLAGEGTAIVLTTHYLEEVDQLADHVLVVDHGGEVAAGSPEALKRDLGGDVLEIRLSDPADSPVAAGMLGHDKGTVIDDAVGRLDVPVADGAERSLALLRQLQDGGIAIADFQLRRPTLDDVFLALTGAPAMSDTEEVA